ncbi:type II secretion system protein [Lentibacillus sp. Marseille-P4043]|uniref:type II secretion system protein n=1 Tax=Lentibacillus sp. Marseille-P4043 TaxID=2040293 RepID=UPI000D0ACE29|nr:type II secretion system protein [Lentibacillus sp. Marseille-P4043]
MTRKIDRKSNSGFTLIEIIASIAILGMVIAVFLPIFPQIMKWTVNTDNELVASNLLGQVAYDVKNASIIDQKTGTISICPTYSSIKKSSLGNLSSYTLNDNDYSVKLHICKEKDVDLYRTNIQIYTATNKKVSESYTYISGHSGDVDE